MKRREIILHKLSLVFVSFLNDEKHKTFKEKFLTKIDCNLDKNVLLRMIKNSNTNTLIIDIWENNFLLLPVPPLLPYILALLIFCEFEKVNDFFTRIISLFKKNKLINKYEHLVFFIEFWQYYHKYVFKHYKHSIIYGLFDLSNYNLYANNIYIAKYLCCMLSLPNSISKVRKEISCLNYNYLDFQFWFYFCKSLPLHIIDNDNNYSRLQLYISIIISFSKLFDNSLNYQIVLFLFTFKRIDLLIYYLNYKLKNRKYVFNPSSNSYKIIFSIYSSIYKYHNNEINYKLRKIIFRKFNLLVSLQLFFSKINCNCNFIVKFIYNIYFYLASSFIIDHIFHFAKKLNLTKLSFVEKLYNLYFSYDNKKNIIEFMLFNNISFIKIKIRNSLSSNKSLAVQCNNIIESNNYYFRHIASRFSNIILQPKHPDGFIFIPNIHSLQQISYYPLLINEFKKLNFCVINLHEEFLYSKRSGTSIDRYMGNFSNQHLNVHLYNKFIINFSRKEIIADGINFYNGVYDKLSIIYRNPIINFDNFFIKTHFYSYFLPVIDYYLFILNDIYLNIVKNMNSPIYFLTDQPHNFPNTIIRDWSLLKSATDTNINFVAFRPFYELFNSNEYFSSLHYVNLTRERYLSSAAFPTHKEFFAFYNNNLNNIFDINIQNLFYKKFETKIISNDHDIKYILSNYKSHHKTIVCCFCRLTCDFGLPIDNGPAHTSMVDWLYDTISIISECKDFILVIKPHPGELDPFIFNNGLPIKKLFNKLPDNVICLNPNSISNHELASYINLAIVWYGTSAIEMLSYGIPTLVCSFYCKTNFPLDFLFPSSRNNYRKIILSRNYGYINKDSIRKAKTYLYFLYSSTKLNFNYEYSYNLKNNQRQIISLWNTKLLLKYKLQGDKIIKNMARDIINTV